MEKCKECKKEVSNFRVLYYRDGMCIRCYEKITGKCGWCLGKGWKTQHHRGPWGAKRTCEGCSGTGKASTFIK